MATQIALDATGTKLNFDSNTFVIDESTNKVGIGTASPDEKLQVNGASGLDGATPPTIKIHSSSAGDWTDNATFAKLAFGNDDTSGGIACSINAYVDSNSGNNSGLSFYTSASANTPLERLRIDKAGNVGIGTTSPLSNLHIVETGGGSGSLTIDSNENNATLQLRAGLDGEAEEASITFCQASSLKWQVGNSTGNDFFIYDYTRSAISFQIQDNGHMALMQSGGNVGIGNTSPSTKLHLTTSDSGTTLNNFSGIHIQNSDTTNGSGNAIVFSNSTVGNGWTRIGVVQTASQTTDLFFSTMNNGNASEKLRIKSDGKVGIGTTSPSFLLDVHGASNPKIRVKESTNTVEGVLACESDRVNVGSTSSHELKFLVGNSAKMTLDTSGKLGIGTTSPAKILDITSTTSGFLPPRMTTTQRDAISSPTAGEIIYNTTTNVLNFYNGSAWGAV
jgi:hypothetical protein